jgi:hypothetical protein
VVVVVLRRPNAGGPAMGVFGLLDEGRFGRVGAGGVNCDGAGCDELCRVAEGPMEEGGRRESFLWGMVCRKLECKLL